VQRGADQVVEGLHVPLVPLKEILAHAPGTERHHRLFRYTALTPRSFSVRRDLVKIEEVRRETVKR
jgi:hypothetical protein